MPHDFARRPRFGACAWRDPEAALDSGSGNLGLGHDNPGAVITCSSWLMPALSELYGFSGHLEACFTALASCAAKAPANHQPAQAWTFPA